MSGRTGWRDAAEKGVTINPVSPSPIRSGSNRFANTYSIDGRVFGSGVVRESIEQSNGQTVHKIVYVKNGMVRTSVQPFNPLKRLELVPAGLIAAEIKRPQRKPSLGERIKQWLRLR